MEFSENELWFFSVTTEFGGSNKRDTFEYYDYREIRVYSRLVSFSMSRKPIN